MSVARTLRVAVLSASTVLLLIPFRAAAADSITGATSGDAPASFDLSASALPVDIELSAPSALPLDAEAGLAYSGVGVNSQPLILSEAAPAYVPLLSATGLLGGSGNLAAIVVGLAPGLVVGAPTLVGLPPLPVNPTLVPLGELAKPISGLPIPNPPPLGCSANLPGDPRESSCGGPVQNLLGFDAKAASAHTVAGGTADDPASLHSESSAAMVGVDPAVGQTLVPVSAGGARSAAFGRVQNGRAESGAATSTTEISIGGVVRIPSLDSSVSAALGGTPQSAAVSERRCSLAGATIAGVPVEFRPDGFVIASQATLPVPVSEATDLVNKALEQAHVAIASTGRLDPGVLEITPYPGPKSRLSPDGTALDTSFGCLELRYRIPVSGTDVKVTFGKTSLRMSVFGHDLGTGSVTGAGGSGSVSASALSLSDAGTVGGESANSGSGSPSALPSVGGSPPAAPTPGAGSDRPSATPFVRSAITTQRSWRFPYSPLALLVLAGPLLIQARRVSFTRR